MSVNRVIITGNLTRDGELAATQSGSSVLRLGVAVNDRWRNPQTDQWEDRPNYIDCVMFGNRAQSISRFLTKGTKVAVEGRLRWSQWVDRDTQKNRSKVEVVVDDIEFMGPRREASGGGAPGTPAPQAPQAPTFQTPPAPVPPQAPEGPAFQVPPAPPGVPPGAPQGVYDDVVPF